MNFDSSEFRDFRSGYVPHLVIVRCQLIEALLDNMVAIEVLDERDDVHAEREDNGGDLAKIEW